MEVKKSPKADLKRNSSTYLLIGYVIVLSVIFVAFEWTQRDIKIDTSQAVSDVVFEEEIIPITDAPQKPPPPPVETPKAAELLEIVDDETEVEETVIAETEELGQEVEIKQIVQVDVVEDQPEEEEIFEVVEESPSFKNGGYAGLMKYLHSEINYPTISQENGVQGKVIVQFVVNKDGSIVNAVIMRGVDPYLDKEALRVVNSMPKWNPGKQRGKPVRAKFTLPVTFRLR